MAEPPEIQYVDCGGRDLAYEVIGTGTAGFLVYLECGAHLDLMWTDPAWRQQAERFGELWRAAFFQMPGDWELLAATGGTTLPSVPAEPLEPRLSDRLIVTAARRMPRVMSAVNRLDSARSRRSGAS